MLSDLSSSKRVLSVPLEAIRLDDSTQLRVATDPEYAGELALALQAGDTLPPPVLFKGWEAAFGDVYWVGDGHHTLKAHSLAGLNYVNAVVYDGGQRDAILYAAGANAKHGRRRSNDDKRKAVGVFLDDEEWSGWDNYAIADQCQVTEGFVRKLRRERQEKDSGQVRNAYNTPPGEVGNSAPSDPNASVAAAPVSGAHWCTPGGSSLVSGAHQCAPGGMQPTQEAPEWGGGEWDGVEGDELSEDDPDVQDVVAGLPAEVQAAWGGMSAEEKRRFLEAAKSDQEVDEEDELQQVQDRIKYHVAELRKWHSQLPDVSQEADAALDAYWKLVNGSKVFDGVLTAGSPAGDD